MPSGTRREAKLTRRERLVGEVATFVRQYARKDQRGVEPNDRHFTRKVERKVQRMSPDELDELLRDDPER